VIGGPSECPASFEAVMEVVEAGDTGCPICGGPPEEHAHEDREREPLLAADEEDEWR
jgi:hypothetical protein